MLAEMALFLSYRYKLSILATLLSSPSHLCFNVIGIL